MKKISSAHVLLLVITAFQLVVSLGLSLLLAFVPGFYLPMWLQLLLSPLTMVIPFAIYCIWTRSNPLTLIRFKKVKPLSIVLAVLVMVFAYPVIILLNLLSMLFVDNAMANVLPSVVEMGIIPALLLMAVIPAVMEETIFRGCLYNAYSRVRPLAGVFLSALLFGLMHMNFNQMPYAFFLGVIMALMLEATDSIVIPMIMHFSLNGFTTVLSFLTMGASQGMAAASSGSTSLTDAISQAYKEVMVQEGLSQSMSSAQVDALVADMVPTMLGVVIGILVVVALVALIVVLALIYAAFAINGRSPKEILLARPQADAYVKGLGGKMRKNRMIDIPVIVFIIYALEECIRSSLM